MITITLPWPHPILFPNAAKKEHWMPCAEAKRNARAFAKYTVAGMHVQPPTTPCRVTYIFHKPDHRVRDLDGCHSAMKSAQDGIADALGIDDRHFHPVSLDWGENVSGGQVVVTIGE